MCPIPAECVHTLGRMQLELWHHKLEALKKLRLRRDKLERKTMRIPHHATGRRLALATCSKL